MNSPEDGPVGPKHVEIRQYINKIEKVTSVGFYSISSIYIDTVRFDLECSMFTGVSFFRYIITCHVECGISLNPIGCQAGSGTEL